MFCLCEGGGGPVGGHQPENAGPGARLQDNNRILS